MKGFRDSHYRVAPETNCLDDDQVMDLVLARIEKSDLPEIDEHLDCCPDCRTFVAQVAKQCLSTGDEQEPLATVPSTKVALLQRGENLGRYMILERIGAGAMGVVYAAYDPELDRKVALKLIRPRSGDPGNSVSRRERLQREARAMARVSHPNVTVIHDVGTIKEQIFIAMEYVEGVTLRVWLQQENRGPKEILEIFAQAGRGLSAAHAAGLIHRDFKPDNVFVDRSGRALVGDFGLVRMSNSETPDLVQSDDLHGRDDVQLTRTGMVVGTALYMSPEQHEGKASDERGDQFSFCVALYEALCGQRPFEGEDYPSLRRNVLLGNLRTPPKGGRTPKRIWNLLRRGLSHSPNDRFPSMPGLIAELSHDTAIVHRRFIAGGGLACIAGLAFFAWSQGQNKPEFCASQGQLTGVWDSSVAGQTKAAFTRSKAVHAKDTYLRVKRHLDDYSQNWELVYSQTCKATHVDGSQSEPLLDLRMQCLDRRKSELAALVDTLRDGSNAGIIDKAVQITSELISAETCTAEQALLPVHLPDEPKLRKEVQAMLVNLDTIFAMHKAGKITEALPLAQKLANKAAAIDFQSLRAKALLLLGSLQDDSGDLTTAEKTLREAIQFAAQARENILVSTGLLKLAANLRSQSKNEELVALKPWLETSIAQAGSTTAQRVVLLKLLGAVAFRQGDVKKSHDLFNDALQLLEREPDSDPLAAAGISVNIGLTLMYQGKYQDAEDHIRRGLEATIALLGPSHPRVAQDRLNLGNLLDAQGKHAEAEVSYRQALAVFEGSLQPSHANIGQALNNLAIVVAAQERVSEARRNVSTIMRQSFC